eukprot:52085-Rhodomonas_salina.4
MRAGIATRSIGDDGVQCGRARRMMDVNNAVLITESPQSSIAGIEHVRCQRCNRSDNGTGVWFLAERKRGSCSTPSALPLASVTSCSPRAHPLPRHATDAPRPTLRPAQ